MIRRLQSWSRRAYVQQMLLFLACLLLLLRTMAPTVYELDSAEFSTGAAILGIVHSPGYPLFTLLSHLFTLLPIGDIAYRVNLFTAVCLALTAPVLYRLLSLLIADRRIVIVSTLLFMWSYYVWSSGTAAEIYAPQIFTLALVGWSLARMIRHPEHRGALRTGLLYGVAVAMTQSSIFFAPGLVLAFYLLRVPWWKSTAAGVISLVVVLITFAYFPLRESAYPDFNKIGYYDNYGVYHSFDFHSPRGILEAVSAEQFHPLFFADGFLPTPARIGMTLSWFWRNFLGIGFLVGIVGLIDLHRNHRRFLLGWSGFFVPYTYFYMCYGAVDRDTMFGPGFLLWAIPLAFGLHRVLQPRSYFLKYSLTVALPLLALVVNFGSVDLSHDTAVRDHAEAVLNSLPKNAIAVGYWADVTPLQYMHFVEKQRPDVHIYDLFLFPPNDFHQYMDYVSEGNDGPIVFVTNSALTYLFGTPYIALPILAANPDGQQPFVSSFEAMRVAVSAR